MYEYKTIIALTDNRVNSVEYRTADTNAPNVNSQYNLNQTKAPGTSFGRSN